TVLFVEFDFSKCGVHSFPTRRSSDLGGVGGLGIMAQYLTAIPSGIAIFIMNLPIFIIGGKMIDREFAIYAFISMFVLSFMLTIRSEEHTSELQSRENLVCRLLLEKKN